MSKRYIFLAFVLLASAFGLTRLPETPDRNQIPAGELLLKINDPAKYQTTHQIAKRLIERDPSLFLIDVRTAEQFEEYNIPGSFNIPLEEIMAPDWADYINQEDMDIVFYSNADVYADQAWMLHAQQGVKNLYVMKGGVNEWFSTIIQPSPPPETAPSEAFDLYAFERAACIYFGGASAGVASAPPPKKAVTVRRKEKKAAEGGC
jgi:rhodanese-related sulfurtransferase